MVRQVVHQFRRLLWLSLKCPARSAALVMLALCLLTTQATAGRLTAEQILLVVNRNDAAGVELAKYYAKQRGVPADRIVELDLPTADEISLDEYEQLIAEPLGAVLRQPAARDIRCLLTFTGVPFRIAPRSKDLPTLAELKLIGEHRRQVANLIEPLAMQAEQIARQIDSQFQPPRGKDIDPGDRVRAAAAFAMGRVGAITDENLRKQVEQKWEQLWASMQQPVTLTEPAADAPAATRRSELPVHPGGLNLGSAAARRQMRQSARQLGPLQYEQILAIQSNYLSFEQTDASVDSELATVLWGPHIRPRWQANPLHFGFESPTPPPTTMMVMRLDGPSLDVLRRLIDDGIAVEREGLRGIVVLDSWAKPAKKPDGSPDGYGIYDESIRRLERIISTRSKLKMTYEASDQLVAENSQREIALYCGWYDPNRVVLPGEFARGAVGFHVASWTAVGLRAQAGGWWVPALLQAGVVGTLGPVSEPYLPAFPSADEFFPLLMTGRLTLAEVYWKTSPMVSWKMLAIGDPLYTPYKANPALSVADLPQKLQSAVPAE